MKTSMIKKTLIAATAAATVLAAGQATAQDSQSGNSDIMLGFNPFGPFGTNDISVTAPSYIIGFRLSEELMPFIHGSINDEGGNLDTEIIIGGGARFYLDNISENVRTFAGASMGIINQDDTGFGIGAFFGAEAMVTEALSVSGQLGTEIKDRGCDTCDTQFELGTANVMFNLYF